MNTTLKKTVRYSESFKLEIIRYIEEEGYSINDVKPRLRIRIDIAERLKIK